MDATDKVLLVGAVVAGAVLGNHFADIIGAVVGGFAGLGVLCVGYIVGETINQKLSDHYRKV